MRRRIGRRTYNRRAERQRQAERIAAKVREFATVALATLYVLVGPPSSQPDSKRQRRAKHRDQQRRLARALKHEHAPPRAEGEER